MAVDTQGRAGGEWFVEHDVVRAEKFALRGDFDAERKDAARIDSGRVWIVDMEGGDGRAEAVQVRQVVGGKGGCVCQEGSGVIEDGRARRTGRGSGAAESGEDRLGGVRREYRGCLKCPLGSEGGD